MSEHDQDTLILREQVINETMMIVQDAIGVIAVLTGNSVKNVIRGLYEATIKATHEEELRGLGVILPDDEEFVPR